MVSETRGQWIVFLIVFLVVFGVALAPLILSRGTAADWCTSTEFGGLSKIPWALTLIAEGGLAVVLALGGLAYWAIRRQAPKLLFTGIAGVVAAVAVSFMVPFPDCMAYVDSLPGHRPGRVEVNLVGQGGETAALTADAKCVIGDDLGETHVNAFSAPMTAPSGYSGDVQVTLTSEHRVQSVSVGVRDLDHGGWGLLVDDWKYGGAQLRSGWTRESGVIDITPNSRYDWRGTVSWNCPP